MSLKKKLMPHFAQLITSDSLRTIKYRWSNLRKTLSPSLNHITFYHRLNDPYSYLLLQSLPELLEQHKISITIEFVLNMSPELNPEQKKLQQYGLVDAVRLANKYDLQFPVDATLPTISDTFNATSCLLKQKQVWSSLKDSKHFIQLVTETTAALWGDSTTTLQSCSNRYGSLPDDETQRLLDEAINKLHNNQHYMSAMLNYGSEWYWGVDRLNHLRERLKNNSINKNSKPLDSLIKVGRQHTHPVDFYFSFRSPYSYLAAEKLFKLAEQYQLTVNIKPIMPMVMRGFQIPKVKRMYIIHDAKREASLNNIPFGKIFDPIGGGVERCLALFFYAKAEGKEREFISSITRAIWSQGTDVSNAKIMEDLLIQVGLDKDKARVALASDDWKNQAENNRKDLNELGLWGVPCFKYKSLTLWGQDRIWALEQAIKQTS